MWISPLLVAVLAQLAGAQDQCVTVFKEDHFCLGSDSSIEINLQCPSGFNLRIDRAVYTISSQCPPPSQLIHNCPGRTWTLQGACNRKSSCSHELRRDDSNECGGQHAGEHVVTVRYSCKPNDDNFYSSICQKSTKTNSLVEIYTPPITASDCACKVVVPANAELFFKPRYFIRNVTVNAQTECEQRVQLSDPDGSFVEFCNHDVGKTIPCTNARREFLLYFVNLRSNVESEFSMDLQVSYPNEVSVTCGHEIKDTVPRTTGFPTTTRPTLPTTTYPTTPPTPSTTTTTTTTTTPTPTTSTTTTTTTTKPPTTTTQSTTTTTKPTSTTTTSTTTTQTITTSTTKRPTTSTVTPSTTTTTPTTLTRPSTTTTTTKPITTTRTTTTKPDTTTAKAATTRGFFTRRTTKSPNQGVTFTTPGDRTKQSVSIYAVIGGSIGGAVGFVALVVVLIIVCGARNRRRPSSHHQHHGHRGQRGHRGHQGHRGHRGHHRDHRGRQQWDQGGHRDHRGHSGQRDHRDNRDQRDHRSSDQMKPSFVCPMFTCFKECETIKLCCKKEKKENDFTYMNEVYETIDDTMLDGRFEREKPAENGKAKGRKP